MDVCTTFIASAESAVLVQPGERPLDNPAEDAQPGSVWCSPCGNMRLEATRAQFLPMWFRVVCPVRVDFVRSMSWTAPFAAYPRDRVDQWYQLRDVMRIRAGQDRRKRNSIRIGDQMMFAARLPPIRRIRPGFPPPPTARMEALSTMARDQSMPSVRRNFARRTSCSLSHTPACCQSRRRRQQVIPDPHPISCGSISHGIPLFNTKRVPVSALRSSTGF